MPAFLADRKLHTLEDYYDIKIVSLTLFYAHVCFSDAYDFVLSVQYRP